MMMMMMMMMFIMVSNVVPVVLLLSSMNSTCVTAFSSPPTFAHHHYHPSSSTTTSSSTRRGFSSSSSINHDRFQRITQQRRKNEEIEQELQYPNSQLVLEQRQGQRQQQRQSIVDKTTMTSSALFAKKKKTTSLSSTAIPAISTTSRRGKKRRGGGKKSFLSSINPFFNKLTLNGKSAMKMSSSSKSPVGVGLEAALLLNDKKRRKEFKKDVSNEYPFVPDFVLDICLDSLADAFSSVAPSQLKEALRPGGLEKVRPDIERTVVQELEKQALISELPLHKDDKRKVLQFLVGNLVDYMLQDVNDMLMDPKQKLQYLDEQRQDIQRFMSLQQLTLYRIQYYPFQTLFICATTYITFMTIFQQFQQTIYYSMIMSTIIGPLSSFLQSSFHVVSTYMKVILHYLAKLVLAAKRQLLVR